MFTYTEFWSIEDPACRSMAFDRKIWWYRQEQRLPNYSNRMIMYWKEERRTIEPWVRRVESTSEHRWRHKPRRYRASLWIVSMFPSRIKDTAWNRVLLGTNFRKDPSTWSVCLIKPRRNGSQAWYRANMTRPTPQHSERMPIKPTRFKIRALQNGNEWVFPIDLDVWTYNLASRTPGTHRYRWTWAWLKPIIDFKE